MEKDTKEIITKQHPDVVRGLLMDLVELDSRNEDRVRELILKY